MRQGQEKIVRKRVRSVLVVLSRDVEQRIERVQLCVFSQRQ